MVPAAVVSVRTGTDSRQKKCWSRPGKLALPHIQRSTPCATRTGDPKATTEQTGGCNMVTVRQAAITITDSRLRDGVYGVVLDTITTLMEKNT